MTKNQNQGQAQAWNQEALELLNSLEDELRTAKCLHSRAEQDQALEELTYKLAELRTLLGGQE